MTLPARLDYVPGQVQCALLQPVALLQIGVPVAANRAGCFLLRLLQLVAPDEVCGLLQPCAGRVTWRRFQNAVKRL